MVQTSIILAGLLVLGVVAVAQPVGAQESTPTLSGATLTVNAGDTNEVQATYRISVPAGTDSVSGTFWVLHGVQMNDLSVSVDGSSVSPSVSKNSGYWDVAVPVGDAAGGTAEVSMTYSVTGLANKVKAPIWVPNASTSGTDRVVEGTLTLPSRTQAHGEVFPKPIKKRDRGRVLVFDQYHVPAFVSATYGASSGSVLTTSNLMGLLAIILILGTFGLWGAYNAGYILAGGN